MRAPNTQLESDLIQAFFHDNIATEHSSATEPSPLGTHGAGNAAIEPLSRLKMRARLTVDCIVRATSMK